MGKCINHPDRETSYHCQKHNLDMCEECMRCRDPELYCKHRTACVIHFLTQKVEKERPADLKTKDCATSAGAGRLG